MKFHILIVSTVLTFYVSCTNDIKTNNDTQYGSFLKKQGVEFRLYAPNSSKVELIIIYNLITHQVPGNSCIIIIYNEWFDLIRRK